MQDKPLQESLFADDDAEQSSVEYKTSEHGQLPKDIWEAVTGFSNAEGGRLIFGVKPNHEHIGLSKDDIDSIQRNLQSSCLSEYSYRIHPEIAIKGDTVTAYIPPAPAAVRPVYHTKHGPIIGARVRVGSSNEKLDENWLKRFAIAAKGGAELMWEDSITAEVLDRAGIEMYIQRLNITRGGVYERYTYDELLLKLSITNKKGEVSLFGLLAFSADANLQDIVSPTLTISVTQYPGNTKVADDGSTAYLDKKEFFGPVSNQFNQALQFIVSKVPIQGKIDRRSGVRTDNFTVPVLAIREALANTLAHRDYGVHSSKIQIDIYNDRIEFINPGNSLVPIAELDSTSSVTRNPLLMNYLREMGLTEHLARGIRTIKNELRQAGLKEPAFTNTSTSFVATIFSTAFITPEEMQWLERFSDQKLNERQTAGLVHLRISKNGINNAEYRKLNGLTHMGDDKKANKELKRMVDKGILIKVGDYINTRYYLAEVYKD